MHDGFLHLLQIRFDVTLKRHARFEFRHQIVVVRIKPLRHLHRRLLSAAARECKVVFEFKPAGREAKPRRHTAKKHCVVQHMIVEGKVACSDEPKPCRFLCCPITGAQVPPGVLE